MADYRKLRVWQQARKLTRELYTHTAEWPAEERFGMITQVRRAAHSIGANLAEGCGRGRYGEFANFARIALGSVNELESFCEAALDHGYWSSERAAAVLRELRTIRQMLTGLVTWADGKRKRRPRGLTGNG